MTDPAVEQALSDLAKAIRAGIGAVVYWQGIYDRIVRTREIDAAAAEALIELQGLLDADDTTED